MIAMMLMLMTDDECCAGLDVKVGDGKFRW